MPYIATPDDADINHSGEVNVIDLSSASQHSGKLTSYSPLVSQMIQDRGNKQVPHEITLVDPPRSWSWGTHGEENDMSTGSCNFWMVAEPDAAIAGQSFTQRIAIKSCHLLLLVNGQWSQRWDGNPGLSWCVSCNYETNGNYSSIPHNTELDGAWSFALPTGKAIHCAQSSPGLIVPIQPQAVVAVMIARMIGGQVNWGVNCGADWKTAQGGAPPIAPSAGIGRFLRLGSHYRRITMLASPLNDDQLRANPPPNIVLPS